MCATSHGLDNTGGKVLDSRERNPTRPMNIPPPIQKRVKLIGTVNVKHGLPNRYKPTAPWGRGKDSDPNITVGTPRSRRNRYQQSRCDRLKMAEYTPSKSLRGKLRGGLQWNNEGGVRQVWRD